MRQSGIFVVMGVAGAGKTTVGSILAQRIGVEFVEGDAYHPPENVRRMAAGIPLTDADRAGWLEALAARLRVALEGGSGLVMSCSALKRSYRDVLRAAAPDVRFIFLDGPRALIAERLASRRGHYMPAALLDSQFATLERPGADEHVRVCSVTEPPDAIVAALMADRTQ
jgi:gluconokinase